MPTSPSAHAKSDACAANNNMAVIVAHLNISTRTFLFAFFILSNVLNY